jgi:mRNA-degrading endonuclease YafQ of YafQ-DinJ toxin-antitoxin module
MSIEVLACARTGLVELKEPLYLVYAFASDPAALVLFLTGSHSSLSTP